MFDNSFLNCFFFKNYFILDIQNMFQSNLFIFK